MVCRCEDTEMDVENLAQQYLSGHYSAEFTITNIWRIPTEKSPIPSILSSYFWQLDVASNQFPGETFCLYYKKDFDTGKWSWSDNYYTLLLYDEAQKYFSRIVEEYFETDYLIDFIWGARPWPNGTGEGTSFADWLESGGRIVSVNVYLREEQISNEICRPLAEKILYMGPFIGKVVINSFASDGFDQASNRTISEIWNEKSIWHLGHLYYLQRDSREEEQ